jgi:hypothetical protein
MKEHSEKGYSSKHSPERKVRPEVAREVKGRVKSGEIPCASAFAAAEELGVSPEEIGFTADRLEIPITRCQLGLHGWGPEKKRLRPPEEVPEPLETAIRSRLEKGRLPCRSAWEVAGELGLGKMEVASACEALGIKISACQLGAF